MIPISFLGEVWYRHHNDPFQFEKIVLKSDYTEEAAKRSMLDDGYEDWGSSYEVEIRNIRVVSFK